MFPGLTIFSLFTFSLLQVTTLPSFRSAYLWFGLAGLVLVLLILAFAYLLLTRHFDRIRLLIDHRYVQLITQTLAQRTPRLWSFIQQRLSIQQWHGLLLTVTASTILLFVFLFAFISVSWIGRDDLYSIDLSIHQTLQGAMNEPALDFFRLFTYLAGGGTIVVASLLLAAIFIVRKEMWRLVSLFLIVGVGEGILWLLKGLFGRERPEGHLTGSVYYSFPSGHSFASVVLYGFLLFLTWTWTKKTWIRLSVSIFLIMLIVLIGMSRVVLSVHWFSDVLGGYTIGLAWLVLCLVAIRAFQERKRTGTVIAPSEA